MAVTAQRTVVNVFTGDVVAQLQTDAAANTASPGQVQVIALSSGANTISVPPIAPSGVTIIPPAGNTAGLTLKGISGDTGIGLHLTDPTSLGLSTTQTTIVVTAAVSIPSVRFIWS